MGPRMERERFMTWEKCFAAVVVLCQDRFENRVCRCKESYLFSHSSVLAEPGCYGRKNL